MIINDHLGTLLPTAGALSNAVRRQHNNRDEVPTNIGIQSTMSQNNQFIQHMQDMARDGSKVSQILRFLVIDHGIEDQLLLMELFRDAFKTPFGSVTAIGAWWHEGERELDDEGIDSYIGYVIEDFLSLS
jgi:hypothetical protein|tara:strand:+ start:142 stop:531 length:390 start_codon:yes stop_codon:yes gene_type:complete